MWRYPLRKGSAEGTNGAAAHPAFFLLEMWVRNPAKVPAQPMNGNAQSSGCTLSLVSVCLSLYARPFRLDLHGPYVLWKASPWDAAQCPAGWHFWAFWSGFYEAHWAVKQSLGRIIFPIAASLTLQLLRFSAHCTSSPGMLGSKRWIISKQKPRKKTQSESSASTCSSTHAIPQCVKIHTWPPGACRGGANVGIPSAPLGRAFPSSHSWHGWLWLPKRSRETGWCNFGEAEIVWNQPMTIGSV